MQYHIDIGALSAEAMAAHTRREYDRFLDKSQEYLRHMQQRNTPLAVQPIEFNDRLSDAQKRGLEHAVRAHIEQHNRQLPRDAAEKLARSQAADQLIMRIRSERRHPTDPEAYTILEALFDTSAASYRN
jgi:hypothetical protein